MTDLQQRILDHYKANPGAGFVWKTLDTDYTNGSAAIDALFDAGLLVARQVPSKSGKTMQWKTFAA